MCQGLKKFLYFAAFFFIFIPLAVSSAPKVKVFKVAYFTEPHVEALTNIAIGIWSEAAAVLTERYVLVKASSKQQALQWLQEKKVRVVLGPLQIKDHYGGVDFVNSYIHNSVGIVVPEQVRVSFFAMLKGYFEALFGVTIVSIIVVMILFSVLMWFVERKKNSSMYPSSPLKGIGDSIWNCLVTFAAVGYGDIVPKTVFGRIIMSMWILLSLFLVSVFVASITSELTYIKTNMDKLANLSQLYDRKVAVIKGDEDALLVADRYHVRPVLVSNLNELIDYVAKQKVLAGFAHIYVLAMYVNQHPDSKVILTPYELMLGNYAIGLRTDDPLQLPLTRLLYTFSEVNRIGEKIGHTIGPMRVEKQN